MLLVPYSKTRWTKAMRINNGIKQAKASQSSLNNFSFRIYRPVTLNRIIVAAKEVDHQQTSNAGLSSLKAVRDGGGDEYIPMVAEEITALVYLRRGTSEDLKRFRKHYTSNGHQLWEFNRGVFGIVVGSSAHRIGSSTGTRKIWYHERARARSKNTNKASVDKLSMPQKVKEVVEGRPQRLYVCDKARRGVGNIRRESKN